MLEFKINEFLTLKLELGKTNLKTFPFETDCKNLEEYTTKIHFWLRDFEAELRKIQKTWEKHGYGVPVIPIKEILGEEP